MTADRRRIRLIYGSILIHHSDLRSFKPENTVICGYLSLKLQWSVVICSSTLIFYIDLRSFKLEITLICGDLWW